MADRKYASTGDRYAAAKIWIGISILCAAPALGQTLRRDAELNGPRLNGVEITAADGKSRLSLLLVRLPKGAALEGTRLLSAAGGAALAAGAILDGEASDHSAMKLRIDRIAPAPDPKPATPDNENADVMTYAISYQLGGAAEWKPLCANGELAIPLSGRWDYHRGQRGDSGRLNNDREVLTFACRGSALTKCIEMMGYKPWLPSRKTESGATISMDALHQACVRAVRADYCGNGDSMTTEGQLVNFYDVAGITKDTENWAFEAAWSPEGAVCINRTRLPKNPEDPRQTVSGYIAKSCLASFSQTPCAGSKRVAAALLFTENNPNPAAPAPAPAKP